MDAVRVRVMTENDVEAVAGLCGELGYPSPLSSVAARFGALRDRTDHALFVAEETPPADASERAIAPNGTGAVVGWVDVHETLTLEGGPWAEIGGLVIHGPARGRGVGKMLVAAAERWAIEHHYPEMRVRSNVVRERAHQFYRRLGYDVVKSQLNFRKPL